MWKQILFVKTLVQLTTRYLDGLSGDPDCVLSGELLGELQDVTNLATAEALMLVLATADVASQAHSVSLTRFKCYAVIEMMICVTWRP